MVTATDAIYRKLPDVVLREELDNWALLFNPANGGVVGISPVGVALWRIMDRSNTIPEMVQALVERCDEVPAEAQAQALLQEAKAVLPQDAQTLGDFAAQIRAIADEAAKPIAVDGTMAPVCWDNSPPV